MSTTAIAALTSVNDGHTSTVSSAATQAATNTAVDTGARLNTVSSAPPQDAITQDLVQLLKALQSGSVSDAKNELAKVKADVNAQANAQAKSSTATDVDYLLKDVSAGNTTAEKTDSNKIQQDLATQAATGSRIEPASIATVSPLDELVGKLTTSITKGSTSTALKDVATYLVQNGQDSGNLVNAKA